MLYNIIIIIIIIGIIVEPTHCHPNTVRSGEQTSPDGRGVPDGRMRPW